MLERLAAVCGAVPAVTLLTNSVANNGNPFGAMDYRLHKGELLDTGAKILEYDGGRSYHGKCFTVDGDLSAVGSFNWDMRSACIDTELMLVIRGEEVNAALRQEMERYEGSALTVLDDETSLPPPGHAPQVLTGTERILQRVLGFFTDWARFLM